MFARKGSVQLLSADGNSTRAIRHDLCFFSSDCFFQKRRRIQNNLGVRISRYARPLTSQARSQLLSVSVDCSEATVWNLRLDKLVYPREDYSKEFHVELPRRGVTKLSTNM